MSPWLWVGIEFPERLVKTQVADLTLNIESVSWSIEHEQSIPCLLSFLPPVIYSPLFHPSHSFLYLK